MIQLPLELQKQFIYFVMAFPTMLVVLFFLVLVFKNKVLYAPSDFKDQSHYLEVNDIKKSVNEKLEAELSKANSTTIRLGKDEIEKIKNTLSHTIDQTTPTTRREQIIDYLDGREAVATSVISDELGIHPNYTMRLLRELHDEGKLVRVRKEGVKDVFWRVKGI